MADVIKTDNIPVVTSLADTDYLLADGAAGMKKITQSNASRKMIEFRLAAEAPADGIWVRLFECNYCTLGMIYLNSYWSVTPPRPMSFQFLGGHNKSVAGTQLIPMAYSPYFPKARVVYDATSNTSLYYVEVLVKTLKATDKIVVMVHGLNIMLVTAYTPGAVPAGWQVKEFDLSEVVLRGGVVRCISIGYKTDSALWKGGLHERSYNYRRAAYSQLSETCCWTYGKRRPIEDGDESCGQSSGNKRSERSKRHSAASSNIQKMHRHYSQWTKWDLNYRLLCGYFPLRLKRDHRNIASLQWSWRNLSPCESIERHLERVEEIGFSGSVLAGKEVVAA